ncbi:hypothetical protein APB90_06330 [Acinetobacter baumannii]|nr:hypothetical protein APB90_06330 [Acinetobacter baumannii]
MDKYGEMGDSLYCYPGTNILKNKLNIHDEQILEQAELALSGLASNLIEYAEPPYDLQYEPYRVCRRVNILRDYPDDKTKLYPRN